MEETNLERLSEITKSSNKDISKIAALKIVIIIFSALFLIANFIPFYIGIDTLLFGIGAISLTENSYEYTNELLEKFKGPPFVPHAYVHTIHNTAIPIGSFGIYGLASFFYLVGGYYGLFYMVPIFTIALLVLYERIATKLFGELAGLVALTIVAFDSFFYFGGLRLLTDNIFALFLVLGCFYLIKFFRERNDRLIFYSSIFFVASTFMRLNGLVFFPIEILLVVGFFVIQFTKKSDKKIYFGKKQTIKNLNKYKNKISKISIFILVPWLLFFLFFFSYNTYFFGEAITTYEEQTGFKPNFITSFFKFDADRFEWIKFYSVGFLPDNLASNLLNISEYEISHFLDKNWLSVFSFAILISAIMISLYYKRKRTEVCVLIVFILVTILAYSSSYSSLPLDPELLKIPTYAPSEDLQERYMIPNLILGSMLFGYLMNSIWKINLGNLSYNRKKIIKGLKIGFLIALSLFLIQLFLESTQVRDLKEYGLTYNVPITFAERYPLDMEGLSENSVVVDSRSRRVIDYGLIPFKTSFGVSKESLWNPSNVDQGHIKILKEIMNDGYEVYLFKDQREKDLDFFRYLQNSHGFVLKNHSETFCKIELNENTEQLLNPESVCIFNRTVVMETIEAKGDE